jgi:hypothetical protein
MEEKKRKKPYLIDVEPAAYASSDDREVQAVYIFQSAINPTFIKEDIKKRDKVPNQDGPIEIMNGNQTIIGKIESQIKALPKGERKISIEVKYLAYSERTTLPFIFIGVDIENKKAFWKRLHPNMPEYKKGNNSFTIHFDENTDAIDSTELYIQKWLELSYDYQNKISIFPELEQEISNFTLNNISKEDRVFAQVLVDSMNNLLDNELKIVKDISFHGIWKLGLGLYDLKEDLFNFQIYQIPYGNSDPLIVEIDKDKFLFKKVNLNARSSRIIQKNSNPEDIGRKIIFDEFRNILDHKRLFIKGELISKEILFRFIDRYNNCLDLKIQDDYKLVDLDYAFNYHFFYLCLTYIEETFKGSSDSGFHSISIGDLNKFASKIDVSTIKASKLSKRFTLISRTIPLNYVFESLEFLSQENIKEISRPFHRRETIKGSFVWDAYSYDHEIENIKKIILNSINEYKSFLEGNKLSFENSDYLNPDIKIICEYESSQIQKNENGSPFFNSEPILRFWKLKDPDLTLPKIIFEDKKNSNILMNIDKRYLLFEGKEYEFDEYIDSSVGYLFQETPTLNLIYRMLERDIRKKYGFSFNTFRSI